MMDGHLLFYRTLPAAAGVPIREENVTEGRNGITVVIFKSTDLTQNVER